MEREHILKTVGVCLNCEVPADQFESMFANKTGLEIWCQKHDLVYFPNPGTGGYTFWQKSQLAEAEEEVRVEEEGVRAAIAYHNDRVIVQPE